MTITNAYPQVRPSLLLDFANTKQLDPRITFTRSTTGTYYDGVTSALAEQNLLLYSQAFSTSPWVQNNGTLTANTTTAPDGTNTASSWVPNTTSTGHYLTQTASSSAGHTVSIYAKPNGYNFVVFADNISNYIYFNVSTGTVGTTGSGWSNAVITSVGNGWYRCSATNSNAPTSNYFYAAQTDNVISFAGDGTSGIYIWGAQLEQRSSVTAYNATTTPPITNYIPVLQTAAANVARLDNNPVTGQSLGLLIEQASTNLLTYSSAFDNAAWSKANATITAAADIAPDGTQTAQMLVEGSGTVVPNINVGPSITASTSYTVSVFAKAAGRSSFQFYFTSGNPSGNPYINYDLSAGTVSVGATGATATISSVGNGWYRCTATYTAATTGAQTIVFLVTNSPSAARANSYTGNGYSGIYIWGAQLEALSFPTSYIPTTSAAVTRTADSASMTGANFSSWYNISQGSIYLEYSVTGVTGGNDPIFISDGTINNSIYPYQTTAQIGMVVRQNGTVTVSALNNYVPVASNYYYKQAISYSTSGASTSTSGATPASAALTSVPTVTRMDIAGSVPISGAMTGRFKKIAYYPVALTTTNLQALTTNVS